MGKIERPSLESLIMDFAMSLTRRATCKRFQVGCVITSEDMTQIYGFGYNGTAKGLSHEDCRADQQGACGCVHSEVNALIKVRANDPRKVVFVTAQPCITCAKAIVKRCDHGSLFGNHAFSPVQVERPRHLSQGHRIPPTAIAPSTLTFPRLVRARFRGSRPSAGRRQSRILG